MLKLNKNVKCTFTDMNFLIRYSAMDERFFDQINGLKGQIDQFRQTLKSKNFDSYLSSIASKSNSDNNNNKNNNHHSKHEKCHSSRKSHRHQKSSDIFLTSPTDQKDYPSNKSSTKSIQRQSNQINKPYQLNSNNSKTNKIKGTPTKDESIFASFSQFISPIQSQQIAASNMLSDSKSSSKSSISEYLEEQKAKTDYLMKKIGIKKKEKKIFNIDNFLDSSNSEEEEENNQKFEKLNRFNKFNEFNYKEKNLNKNLSCLENLEERTKIRNRIIQKALNAIKDSEDEYSDSDSGNQNFPSKNHLDHNNINSIQSDLGNKKLNKRGENEIESNKENEEGQLEPKEKNTERNQEKPKKDFNKNSKIEKEDEKLKEKTNLPINIERKVVFNSNVLSVADLSSDSDDLPVFIPPIPDKIEFDYDFLINDPISILKINNDSEPPKENPINSNLNDNFLIYSPNIENDESSEENFELALSFFEQNISQKSENDGKDNLDQNLNIPKTHNLGCNSLNNALDKLIDVLDDYHCKIDSLKQCNELFDIKLRKICESSTTSEVEQFISFFSDEIEQTNECDTSEEDKN
ncbi:hypothetical protein TRFO_04764 [Tritrichomonas foetus]|uniref:Uncharacterized protein n=1 Tax=Tritrichomonas foetus TaxID=1144522 RepID=A0A1J4KGC5_9EUKA|nr:hypothetical protein TRFO_04764 [Tritrichomonas foetus]|eukprot:OHT08694.1 hypothetical protein TRFO_04764 [Tritrichomonas foetus]